MKRFLLFICICLLFTGCGKKSSVSESGKIVLTYWRHYYTLEDKAIKELILKFQERYPEIIIEYQSMPFKGYRKKLDTSLYAHTGPDIINIHNSWTYVFIKSRYIRKIPLDILSTEKIESDFIPLMSSFSMNGEYYGLPIGSGCLALFINKEHLKDTGYNESAFPRNLEELKQMALKLTRKKGALIKRTGFACGGIESQSWNYLVEGLFRQYGSQIISPDHTKVLWDSSEGIEAFTWYLSFVTEHHIFDLALGKPVNLFMEGRASMIIDGNWIMKKVKEQAPELDFAVYPLPAGKQKATYGSCWGNCVTSSCSDNKLDAAFTFISFLASEESARSWTEKVGEFPLYKKTLKDKQFRTKHKDLIPFIDSMEYAYSSLKKDETAYKLAIIEAIEKAIIKKIAPETALKEAAEKVNRMLEKK